MLPHSVEDYPHVSWKNYFVAAIHLPHDLKKRSQIIFYLIVILVICLWGGGGEVGILYKRIQRLSIPCISHLIYLVSVLLSISKFGSNCQYVFRDLPTQFLLK